MTVAGAACGFASVCDTPLLMVKSSPAESPTMSVAENSHLEREEVERVLASGLFERSPQLPSEKH